jgi:predicted DNA-binding transcriptional regulator YafY
LNAQEAFLLLLAVGTLRSHSDAPYSAERSSLEAKLRAVIPRQDLPGVERMLSAVAVEVPARAQRAPLLDAVVAAAQEKRWLRITYQSAGHTSAQTIFPRRVSARNGLWYCTAYSRERKEERVFRVDRIRQAAPARGSFKAPPVPRAYDDPRHPEIRATFTPRGAAMAEADHDVSARITLHGDGSGVLALRCPPGELPWFARFFAGLGPEVTVEAPKELRERLAELGRELVQRYGSAP